MPRRRRLSWFERFTCPNCTIMWLKSRRVRRRLIGIWGADVAVLYLLVEKDN